MQHTLTRNTLTRGAALSGLLLCGLLLLLADAVWPAFGAGYTVVEIDRASGTVTGRVIASGQTFRFTVKDRSLLDRLFVGQAFETGPALGAMRPGQDFVASFAERDGVLLHPDRSEPCCNLTELVTVHSGQPCCSVVELDHSSGTVTGRVTASGQTFRFTVKDRSLLDSLSVGQAFEISPALGALRPGQDFAASFAERDGVIRPHGGTPCCAFKDLVVKAPGSR